MVSKDEMEKIIDSTDIVSLVSEYVTLEKAGKNYRGLCPFHNEKTPSFFVSPEKKLAHCFSCGKGGSPIQFLMDIKHITFPEALKNLADRNGIKIELNLKPKTDPQFDKYFDINQMAMQFYKRNLTATESGKKALDYLSQRGLSEEIIDKFNIGLSSNEPDLLYQVSKEANILELDMIDIGLIKKKDYSYYDLFTRRIMFPIANEFGNIVGFSGRAYQKGDENQPKYVNSPETMIFKKGNILYNLDRAIPAILKNKRVILHEGFMDVIASYKAGIIETICSMGTALTINQANILKKYTNHAIICYDGDSAGIKASLKAIEIFTKVGMEVHLIMIPSGLDPDDYIKEFGKEKYVKYFYENLIDSIEYSFIQATKDKKFEDFNEIEKVKSFMFKIIASTSSEVIAEKYLNRLAEVFRVSTASLFTDYGNYLDVNKIRRKERRSDSESNQGIQLASSGILKNKKAELRLFNYAKISKEKALYIDSVIGIDAFEDRNKGLWSHIVDVYYSYNDTYDEQKFVSSFEDDDDKYHTYLANTESLLSLINEPYTEDDLESCLKHLKLEKSKKTGMKFVTDGKLSDEEKLEIAIKRFAYLKEYDNNKKRK